MPEAGPHKPFDRRNRLWFGALLIGIFGTIPLRNAGLSTGATWFWLCLLVAAIEVVLLKAMREEAAGLGSQERTWRFLVRGAMVASAAAFWTIGHVLRRSNPSTGDLIFGLGHCAFACAAVGAPLGDLNPRLRAPTRVVWGLEFLALAVFTFTHLGR